MNLLPDCRATVTRGRVFRHGESWVPVFCANCGTEGGLCPEENMTFMFYLCNPCFAKHGAITHTYVMPDDVFFQKVHDEQMERYGRILTHQELVTIVQEDASPLATLLKSGQ